MTSKRLAITASFVSATTLLTACDFFKGLITGPGVDASSLGKLVGALKSGDGSQILEDYVAVAQNVLTKELSFVTVEPDGTFALDVDQAASFVVNFLDSEANYRGTLALGDDQVALVGNTGAAYHVAHGGGHASDQTVTIGFKAGKLGEIRLGSEGQAKLQDPARATRETGFKAPSAAGIGIGFKLTGAGDSTHEELKNALDEDGDGVVDFIDADNDNDGRRDSIDGKANGTKPDGLPAYKTVSSFGFFTNYPTQLGQTTSPDSYIVTVDIQAKSDYFAKLEEAKLVVGPSYARNATIGNRKTPQGTMERVGVWKDSGLTLYKYQGSDGIARIEGFVMGNQSVNLATQMKVGDVYRFKLAYDDGTTEYLTNTIDAIFTTAPSGIKINGTAASAAGHTGVSSAPTIAWDLVKDSGGTTLKGLAYNVEIRKNNELTPGGRVDLGVDKTVFDWSVHQTTLPYDTTAVYEVAVKAAAPGGNTSTGGLRVTAKSSL